MIPRPDPGGAPAIVGVLETSLYAQDLARTAAFYSDLLGLKPLLASARLVAFEVAARSVLLIFQAGATEEDVVDARGVIPGHDGHGRLHLALSIAEDDLEAWRAQTPESFRLRMFPGHHFYLRTEEAAFLEALSGDIEEILTSARR